MSEQSEISEYPLADAAVDNLMREFPKYGHHPSMEMWTDLQVTAQHLEDMANGKLASKYYLNSLATGVGKTSLIIFFVGTLLASKDHKDVGVIICVPLLEEIEALVDAMRLPLESVFIHTGNATYNKLGCQSGENAQVLITTQQKVESLLKNDKSFADLDVFHYRGKPRQVKIWDEALIPWEELTLKLDQIARLPEILRDYNSDVADALYPVMTDITKLADGDTYSLPDFETEYGLSYDDLRLDVFASTEQAVRDLKYAYTLCRLSGKTVSVVKELSKTTAISWRQNLPDDFMPVVVFDASGKVRTMYDHYSKNSGQLELITESVKRFDNVTFHHVNVGGGKKQWRKDPTKLLEATAACINSEPKRPTLVIHPLAEPSRPKRSAVPAIDKTLPDFVLGADVAYLTWGRHKQTNKYRRYDKLVLAGLMYLPKAAVEVRARGAMKLSHEQPVTTDQYADIWIGELKNDILQAVGRICVRGCIEDQAPKADIYILASNKTGHITIAELLQDVFPGCKVKGFSLAGSAQEKWEMAWGYIQGFYAQDENRDKWLPIEEVRNAIGFKDSSNYKKWVKDNPYFQAALKDALVIETSEGKRPTHYRKLPF